MRQKNGFTLVEVLVAVALTGVILLTGYSAFQKIMQAQSRLGAAIDVQKNLFYTNEKLASLIRDGGTIDYEEYFNRRMLGYEQGFIDSPDTDTTLDTYTFTTSSRFGNGNNTGGIPPIYYCGYDSPTPIDSETCLTVNGSAPLGFTNTNKDAATFEIAYPVNQQQAYGQYAALALNYDDPVGFPMPIKLPPIFAEVGGDTSIRMFDRGSGALIQGNPLQIGLPELYLIKKNLDNSYTRTYFRHVYVQDPFPGAATCGVATNPYSLNGCLGKIQMTRLESCDNFLANGSLGSDGIIEAWIPNDDFFIGTASNICPTDSTDIYISAHENTVGGNSPNLTWVDVTAPDMNVIRAAFLPHPLKIPSLMVGAGDPAESPRVSVYLEVQLSTKLRNKSFVRNNMNYPRTLITTYDLSE